MSAVINTGNGQYLAGLTINITGRSGTRVSVTFADSLKEKRNPPMVYDQREAAEYVVELAKRFAPRTAQHFKAEEVTP